MSGRHEDDRGGAATQRAIPVSLVLLGGASAAVLLRLTARDAVPALAGFYYATPLIVAAAGPALAALTLLRIGRARAAAASLAAAIVLGVIWLGSIYHEAPCVASSDGVQVLFWNVARGAAGWERVAEEIGRFDPDVAGFVEATELGQGVVPERLGLGDRPSFVVPGEILISSRWPIIDGRSHDLGSGRAASARVETPAGPLQVVVVDFDNLPFNLRRKTVQRLTEILDGMTPLPTVIMGDFNTPIDATAFEPLRRRFRHAFELAGRGLLVTWPSPLPVLALDHVWVSVECEVWCVRHPFTVRSDHWPVVATVRGGREVGGGDLEPRVGDSGPRSSAGR